MSKIKTEVISFVQTFLATFLSVISISITQLPVETLSNPQTYKASFIAGLLISAVRTALKMTWQKTLPESVGGTR